ncbi:hypothetical protein ATY81_26860 [Rhizobium sp. R72]|nr:hypothetical protein ATY81_26860 [Rhizobium sp. R72]OWV98683.1 hypothetical protein ATY80_26860 [Rhizobium sp. R711]
MMQLSSASCRCSRERFHRRPPTLIVWANNDKNFPAEGAHPYAISRMQNCILSISAISQNERDVMAPLIHDFLDRKFAWKN